MLFEMNRIGMLIEVSHLSEAAMVAALRSAKAPVLLINSAPSSFCNSTNVAAIPDRVLRYTSISDHIHFYTLIFCDFFFLSNLVCSQIMAELSC